MADPRTPPRASEEAAPPANDAAPVADSNESLKEVDIVPDVDSAAPPPPDAEAGPKEHGNVEDQSMDDAVKGDTPPPPAAPKEPEVDIEALATKKRRMAQIADEGKKRSRRMFGVLQATLNKAKQEVSATQQGAAAERRKGIEDRLAAKLSGEKHEMEEKRTREREMKDARLKVLRKEEEINTAETLYQTRHTSKLHLASFLCTTFNLPPPVASQDDITVPFAPRLPHALRISNASAPKPIYYKPFRLLPAQQDTIDDQLASVRRAIQREKDDWRDEKEAKVEQLRDAKRRRDQGMEEIARAEREERQKRRRQDDERNGGDDGGDKRQRRGSTDSPERSRRSAKDDVDMDAAERERKSYSRSPARGGDSPAAKESGAQDDHLPDLDEANMVGVEGEELEY